jgi:lactoylglutathione lyase
LAFAINHIHLKAPDPEETANWYVKAFNFKLVSDTVRKFGDRFIRCESPNGIVVNISGARTAEQMGGGDATPHWGLEHFGVDVDDMDAEIARLEGLGAELMEGPIQSAPNMRIAFIKAPDDVRIELIEVS